MTVVVRRPSAPSVGETGDHVNQRMNGGRDDWKHKRFARSPAAEHFCSPEHDFFNHALFCCSDHNPEQESSRELSDPTPRHSTAILYPERRPVEGLSQGMRQLMQTVVFM